LDASAWKVPKVQIAPMAQQDPAVLVEEDRESANRKPCLAICAGGPC
jgi:hypothetical protein